MIIVLLTGLGLIFGSFVNALIWRIYENTKSKSHKYSMLSGRSVCVHCRHQLAVKDLVPLFSWLWLRGKCRYCAKPIDDNPLVELAVPVLFVVSYKFWPYEFAGIGLVLFIFWLAFLVGLVALAVYDLKWFILPDKITKILGGLASLQAVILFVHAPRFSTAASIVTSALVGGGIFYVLFQISNGRWMGGGDVKLGALVGLILFDGWLVALTIFTASLIGTSYALPLMAKGKLKRTSKIPFGPLLIIGTIIARLFGLSIIHWYKTKILAG